VTVGRKAIRAIAERKGKEAQRENKGQRGNAGQKATGARKD
jgi:hypothetical protein